MNAPAVAGQHIITEVKPPRRMPWSMAIAGVAACVLATAVVTHNSHVGIYTSAAVNRGLTTVGDELCKGSGGYKGYRKRVQPNLYTFYCRDGALHADIEVRIAEPQT